MNDTKQLTIGYGDVKKVKIGGDADLAFILGPCAIESLEHSFKMADSIAKICDKHNVNWIFKACYDKDCRSSIHSFHGLGLEKGLNILDKVRQEYKVPVISDFSVPQWAAATGEVCDMIQVPAYLCRQTSMLRAAAETNRPIHVKKGQYMSPHNMKNVAEKLKYFGNDNILFTDRGTFFGYGNLINDFMGLPIMQEMGYPVCFDGTHSVQCPTTTGTISTGMVQYIPHLVRAACAVGVNALFLEVHDDPKNALSDSGTVLHIDRLEEIIKQSKEIFNLTKNFING